jgi:hypothetical protein
MRERLALAAPVAALVLAGSGCALGSAHATKSDIARIEQLVGPLNQRAVPLRTALTAIIEAAPLALRVDVCSSLQDIPVTVITHGSEELGVLVTGVAMQVDAPFRLYIGHHAEVARPTIYCPEREGSLVTIGKSGS